MDLIPVVSYLEIHDFIAFGRVYIKFAWLWFVCANESLWIFVGYVVIVQVPEKPKVIELEDSNNKSNDKRKYDQFDGGIHQLFAEALCHFGILDDLYFVNNISKGIKEQSKIKQYGTLTWKHNDREQNARHSGISLLYREIVATI